MKKRSRILIGFTAAAVTFASLFAIAGPRHFGGPFGLNQAFHGKCLTNENEQPKSEKPSQPAPEKKAD
jgi:hypothetical protein